MTSKEKVLHFMKAKDKKLYELSGIHLFEKSDFEWFKSLDSFFYDAFIENVKFNKSDSFLCLYCCVYNSHCMDCNYSGVSELKEEFIYYDDDEYPELCTETLSPYSIIKNKIGIHSHFSDYLKSEINELIG